MSRSRRNVRAVTITVACCAASLALAAPTPAAELLGRAVLPAETFAPGPTSGQLITAANGIAVPFAGKQPVQGFSAILPGPRRGTYLVMVDNGFGAKGNSPDALLRVYAVKPDFASGAVAPVDRRTGRELATFGEESFFTLRDPDRRIPFKLVAELDTYPGTTVPVDPAIKAGRLLTGGDLDLESFRRAPDGTLWFGEEFGPYLLHTDASGKVLEAPIPLPNLRGLPTTLGGTAVNPIVQSPSDPRLASPADASIPNSGGFEGMAIDPEGRRLYALLEKPLNGDPRRERLLLHAFSLRGRAYTGETWGYLMDSPGNAIGDLTALTDRQFLVIERDNGQGATALFKRLFRIDLDHTDAEGNLVKEEVADLMRIYDPRDVAGDGAANTTFTMPFVTIEDLLILDRETLLVVNDNNFPFSSGRTAGRADDDEFILIHVAPLLPAERCEDGRGHEDGDGDRR